MTKKLRFIFINIFILILIYPTSLLLSNTLPKNNDYSYIEIPLVLDNVKLFNNLTISSSHEIPINDIFFLKFLNTLNFEAKNNLLLNNICPKDIFDYDARNIKMFNIMDRASITDYFSVKISTNNRNVDEVNQCFQFIFFEKLNEFYLNELSKIKKSLLQLIQFYSNSSIQNNIYQTTQYSYGNDFLLRELVFKIKLLDNTKFLVDHQIFHEIKIKKKVGYLSNTIIIFLTLFLLNILIQSLIFFYSNKKKIKIFNKFFGIQ
jgi:hypothetical protein